MIRFLNLSEATIWSIRARSVLSTFPKSGKIAWNLRSRPCFADPPAESPSTINNSEISGSFDWQSAKVPGRVAPSRAPFLITASLAARAAKRARAASITLSITFLASCGCSSRKVSKPSLVIEEANPWISGLFNFALVWDSNCKDSDGILM